MNLKGVLFSAALLSLGQTVFCFDKGASIKEVQQVKILEKFRLALEQAAKEPTVGNLEVALDLLAQEGEAALAQRHPIKTILSEAKKLDKIVSDAPASTLAHLVERQRLQLAKQAGMQNDPKIREGYWLIFFQFGSFMKDDKYRSTIMWGLILSKVFQGLLSEAEETARAWITDSRSGPNDRIQGLFGLAEFTSLRLDLVALKAVLAKLRFLKAGDRNQFLILQASLDYYSGNSTKCEKDLNARLKLPFAGEENDLPRVQSTLASCLIELRKGQEVEILINSMNSEIGRLATWNKMKLLVFQKKTSEAYSLCPSLFSQSEKADYSLFILQYATCLAIRGKSKEPSGFENRFEELHDQLLKLARESIWIKNPLLFVEAVRIGDNSKVARAKIEILKTSGKKSLIGMALQIHN